MKCSHFNRYIDNGWTDTDEFIEHLVSCESCSEKYDDLLNAYSEYEEVFKHDSEPIDVSSDVMKVINKGNKRVASRRLSVAAAILVLFGSIFVYRENFISFALEIPGISMIVKNMIGEGYLESAIENGEGVYDLVYEKDGYTLYIKDLYVTKDFAGFKYSITAPYDVKEDVILHLIHEKPFRKVVDRLNFKGGKTSQWAMKEFSIGEREMVNGTAKYSVAIISKATEEIIVEFPSVEFVSQSDKKKIDRTY